MGFIHEVDSDICGVEERSESVILRDDSDNSQQLFFNHERPSDIQKQIVTSLMLRAGEAFSRNDEQEAKRLKKSAADVNAVTLTERRVAAVEVTKPWLRDLYQFISKHEAVLKEDD